jgi:phosphoglycolate phosphatase-like HAD superfamily hydrolase
LNVCLILLDFDYTLVDASECLFPALRAGLKAIGKRRLPEDAELRRLIGLTLEDQFASLAPEREPERFAPFKRAYLIERKGKEAEGTKLIPGVRDALERLRNGHFELGVVSTGGPKRIESALHRLGLMPYLGHDGIIGGAADKSEAILAALERFRVSPAETIYVGDRPEDRDAARRAGVNFIGVKTGVFGNRDFGDCVVLESVAALPEYLKDLKSTNPTHREG